MPGLALPAMEVTPVRTMTGVCGTSARRARIVLLSYTLGQGGTDRVTAILARSFANAGYDVQLVVLCEQGCAESLLAQMTGPEVGIRYVGLPTASRSWDMIRLLRPLAAMLRELQPDVLISTANNTAWLSVCARRIAELTATKLVMKTTNPIVGSRHAPPLRVLRLWGYRHAFAHADAIWTLSGAETVMLRDAYPDSADRIRTVINPYVTEAMLRTADIGGVVKRDAGPLILGIGRLEPQKRFDLLIRAFALVDHPAARLTILGEGGHRGWLEKLADRLGVSDRVTFMDFVDDVSAWLARADLFVLSSRYEGLPAAVLEAMATNCSVVSTDCFASAKSLLEPAEGCGVVGRAEPAELARAVERRLGQQRPKSLAAIARRYSVEQGAADHVAALRGLCDVAIWPADDRT